MGSISFSSIASKVAEFLAPRTFDVKTASKTISQGGANIATVQNVTPGESAALEEELRNESSPPREDIHVVHVPPPEGEEGPGSAVVVIGADAEPQADPETGVVTASFNGQPYVIDPAKGSANLVSPPTAEAAPPTTPPPTTAPTTSQPPLAEVVDPASEQLATGNDHGTLPLYSPDSQIQMWSMASQSAALRGSGNDHGTLPPG